MLISRFCCGFWTKLGRDFDEFLVHLKAYIAILSISSVDILLQLTLINDGSLFVHAALKSGGLWRNSLAPTCRRQSKALPILRLLLTQNSSNNPSQKTILKLLFLCLFSGGLYLAETELKLKLKSNAGKVQVNGLCSTCVRTAWNS